MAKRCRAKNWVFTINNYTPEVEQRLKELDCEWMVFGHEVGENGTPHLQGAIHFAGQRDAKALGKLFPWHLEVMHGSCQDSKTYCTKEDSNYFEKGLIPEDGRKKGNEANKKKWHDAKIAAMEGRLDDIPDDMYIRYKHSFDKIAAENKRDISMDDLGDKELKDSFLWLYGPTGCGKSHTARRIARELGCDMPYIKALNKWWNGYSNQWVTIIEEADPDRCEHLASYFKQWCDKWSFTAEAKGSVFPQIRPRYIIVTSNYSIDECFPKSQDSDPLRRRFTELCITGRTFQANWPTFPEKFSVPMPMGIGTPVHAGNSTPHALECQPLPGSSQGSFSDTIEDITSEQEEEERKRRKIDD